jgi:hypothetical protein
MMTGRKYTQKNSMFRYNRHCPGYGIRTRKPPAMGLGSEPSIIRGIGFIQIQSVKSVGAIPKTNQP